MSTTTSRPPPPSAESIANNEDLLSHLLSHLPPRPLLRCKSVSKHWLTLISHPHFSRLHSLRHPPSPSSALLFFHHPSLPSHTPSSSSFSFIPLLHPSPLNPSPPFFSSSLHPSSDLTILQSSNGLLLLRSLTPSLLDFDYFVANPTINSIFRLPIPPRIGPNQSTVVGVNLAFHPAKIGYCYHVICVSKNPDESELGIDAFSSDTGKWIRVIDCDSQSLPFDSEFERGVYCNGRIHWLSHTDFSAFFDFESEGIGRLAMPPPLEGVYIERFRYLGESMGRLHLAEIRTNSVAEFDVLELEEEARVWSVRYRVNLDVVGRGFEEMFQNYNDRFGRRFRFYAFSILAVVRGEREEDARLVLSVPGKVISYEFETRMTGLLCEVGDQTDKWLPFKGYNAYQFVESLYCV